MLGYCHFIGRICRRFDFSGLYFGKYGIKSYNQLVTSNHLSLFATGKPVNLPISELHIGFDGINDTRTLLGTPIAKSPHFQLVQAMENDEPLDSCEYFKRAVQGTLDFRPAQKIRNTQIQGAKKKFLESKTLIETHQNFLVKTFTIAGRHYIADGKHRVATYQLLGITQVPCQDMTPAIYDSFYNWVYRKMKRRPDEFRKHIRWFEDAYRTNG